MTVHLLERLRAICLALPEATEKIAWGEPTFRVRDKIFAQCDNNHHGSGHFAVWCKAEPGAQEILVGTDPERFSSRPTSATRAGSGYASMPTSIGEWSPASW